MPPQSYPFYFLLTYKHGILSFHSFLFKLLNKRINKFLKYYLYSIHFHPIPSSQKYPITISSFMTTKKGINFLCLIKLTRDNHLAFLLLFLGSLGLNIFPSRSQWEWLINIYLCFPPFFLSLIIIIVFFLL